MRYNYMHSVMRLVFQQLYIFYVIFYLTFNFGQCGLYSSKYAVLDMAQMLTIQLYIIMYTSLHPLTIIIIPVDMTLHHIYHINPLPLHIHT